MVKLLFGFLFVVLTSLPSFAQTRSMEDIQRQQAYEYRRHMLNNPPNQESRGSDPIDDAFGQAIGALFLEAMRQQYARPEAPQLPESRSQPNKSEFSVVADRILHFLVEYHRAMSADMGSIERYYANRVDYGNRGVVGVDAIMREKYEVAEICPSRHYNVNKDSVKFRSSEFGADVYDVYFIVETYCYGASQNTVRDWENLLTVDLSESQERILAVRGQALTASR